MGGADDRAPAVDREDRFALPEAEDVEDATSALHRAYHTYLDLRGHHVATAARLLVSSTGATLVHCAVGKDRTGSPWRCSWKPSGCSLRGDRRLRATNDGIEHIMSTLGTMYGYRLARGADRGVGAARRGAWWGRRVVRTQGVSDGDLTALHDRLVRTSESDTTR